MAPIALPPHALRNPRALISVVLGALILSSVVLVSVVTARFVQKNDQVRRSMRVIDDLDLLLSTIKDAETGQRGFLLTGDDSYLEPYRAALGALDGKLAQLAQLLEAEPSQRERLASLDSLVSRKREELEESLQVRRRGTAADALAVVATGRGLRLMDTIRATTATMRAEEVARRELHAASVARYARALYAGVAVILVAGLGLVVVGFLSMRRELRVRQAEGRSLRSSRDALAAQVTETSARLASATEALSSETETTRALFESAAEGIVVVDHTGRVRRINAKAAQLFGYGREELLGQPIEILLPERFRGNHRQHREAYFAAPRTRSMGTGLDLYGRRKDGSQFPVEVSLSAIGTAQGPWAMALVTDISERRRIEQTARQNEKLAALAALSAGIAHELNNPIGIISSRIELMLDDVTEQPVPDVVVEDLRVLHRNIQRVARIAGGLLSFARQSPAERGPVDVNGSIDETLLLMGKQLSKDGVQMSVSLDRTLGAVLGDTNALQQVLINLLLNARDAMPRGGEVRIETAREPDRAGWLRLTVADTGEGMGSDELARIWEAFYTTKTAGTGLGLSVSHKIIREHGGAVAVQSEPGHGTTFVILLPMVA
jgi:PAS domain S-box-containing protein